MRLVGHSTRLGRKRCSEDASNFEWKSNPRQGWHGLFVHQTLVAKIDNRVVFFLFGGKGPIHWRVTYARGYARVTFMQRCQHEFLPQKGSLTSKKHNSCNRAQLLTIRITRGWGITCWRPIPQPCMKTRANGVLHGSQPKMTELSTLEANSRETAGPLFCPGYGCGLFDLLTRLSDIFLLAQSLKLLILLLHLRSRRYYKVIKLMIKANSLSTTAVFLL